MPKERDAVEKGRNGKIVNVAAKMRCDVKYELEFAAAHVIAHHERCVGAAIRIGVDCREVLPGGSIEHGKVYAHPHRRLAGSGGENMSGESPHLRAPCRHQSMARKHRV